MIPMKPLLAAAALTAISACAAAPIDAPAPAAPGDLVGTWDVALFFSADAPPSSTVMEITEAGDGALTGSFYQSAFEQARYRVQGDTIIISVITSDGSGPYATSGRLTGDGIMDGQTLSTGRDFLMAWRAEKR